MTAYTVHSPWKHAQLTANTVDTVTFDQAVQSVTINSRDGAAEITVAVGTTGLADPTAGQDGLILLPAAVGSVTVPTPGGETPCVVKLISTGTPKYSVGVA